MSVFRDGDDGSGESACPKGGNSEQSDRSTPHHEDGLILVQTNAQYTVQGARQRLSQYGGGGADLLGDVMKLVAMGDEARGPPSPRVFAITGLNARRNVPPGDVAA